MKKTLKIWLWIALVLSAATTVLNGAQGRWPSVAIALCSLVGLCLLLFRGRKLGFQLMCVCAVLSCIVGVLSGIAGGTSPAAAVAMSLVGAALIPGITALFLRGQWAALQ